LPPKEILKKAREKQFPQNSVIDLTMILVNKNGTKRERSIQSKRRDYGNGEAKSVAYFLSPADVKGTAFLVWEHKDQANDIFIYMPSLKKVRRIATDQKNQSFMGSDFSYGDMAMEDVDDADHELTREEQVEGKACWVITSIPKPQADSEYGKVVTWVTQGDYIPQKMELYDKKGALYKVMDVLRAGPVGKEVFPLHFTMEDVQKNHKTEITLDKVVLDQAIPDSEFTQRAIER
jgi:outer membrane lipoprotein-sorting protein